MDPAVMGGGTSPDRSARLRELPLRDLVGELTLTGRQLARKELELARVEVRQDLRSEIMMAGGLGVAGVCALLVLQLLLVAVVLALMESGLFPGWAAAVIVGAVVLLVGTGAGLWGWGRRVRRPLDSTRRSVRDGVRWAKEQVT
jgi:hypothetical protein